MTEDDLLLIQPPVAALPFRREAMDAAPSPLRAFVDCGDQAQTQLWRLDWQRLGEHERNWLEGGEYLPELGFHWLVRASVLMRHCQQHKLAVAILEIPDGRLTQLSISDLMHVMGGDAWLDDAQVALLWGLAHDALTSARPLRQALLCRGAVFPCGDGLNVGWWALPADIHLIGPLA